MSLRVAVVGSGPAGFYAADALLKSDLGVEVDLIERLPTPWGLVRLGVAPDHPEHQGRLEGVRADREARGLPLLRQRRRRHATSRTTELVRLYDAVVYTVGAQTDRRLDIPGEDLPGSWPATAFVAWYNGHPDYQHLEFDLSHERAVVIGNGNVAVDVARMLALTDEELAPTDTTDAAIEAIVGSGHPGDRDARPPRPGAGRVHAARAAGARRARRRGRRRRSRRPRARPRERRPRSRPTARPRGATSTYLQRVRGPRAGGQAAHAEAALLRLAGRDPRRGPRRGDRGRPQRARRRRGRPDPRRADRTRSR